MSSFADAPSKGRSSALLPAMAPSAAGRAANRWERPPQLVVSTSWGARRRHPLRDPHFTVHTLVAAVSAGRREPAAAHCLSQGASGGSSVARVSNPSVSVGGGRLSSRSTMCAAGLANWSWRCMISPEPRAQSPEPRAQSPEPRAQSPEPRAQSPEPRAQSPEPRARAQSPEPRAQSPEPRAQSPEPRAQSPEPRAQSPEPRAQSPEPRAQSPEPRASLWGEKRALCCSVRHARDVGWVGGVGWGLRKVIPRHPKGAAERLERKPRARRPSSGTILHWSSDLALCWFASTLRMTTPPVLSFGMSHWIWLHGCVAGFDDIGGFENDSLSGGASSWCRVGSASGP
ncbi:hypothetical protein J2Y89_001817 [Curtobacterium herbarum]|nr:hypothetical protein [Curtobacterium herbarum]